MKWKILPALLLAAGSASAQVSNGGFEQASVGWAWKTAAPAAGGGATCTNAAYASSGSSRWWMQSPSASGYVAKLLAQIPYANGTWLSCRQIEQTVFVPYGSQLSFVARLGDDISAYDYYLYNPVELSVQVYTVNGGGQVFSAQGQSQKCYAQSGCSMFQAYTVPLAQYWGQTVTLVFRSATYASNGSTGMNSQPSAAYVDNVLVQ